MSCSEKADAENQQSSEREVLVALSGRITAENVVELKMLFESEAQFRPIVLDLGNQPSSI